MLCKVTDYGLEIPFSTGSAFTLLVKISLFVTIMFNSYGKIGVFVAYGPDRSSHVVFSSVEILSRAWVHRERERKIKMACQNKKR